MPNDRALRWVGNWADLTRKRLELVRVRIVPDTTLMERIQVAAYLLAVHRRGLELLCPLLGIDKLKPALGHLGEELLICVH